MTTFSGNAGTVEIGGVAIGEIMSFSVNETGDTVEDTEMGDSWRSHLPTLKSWEGTVELHWDDVDVVQESLIVGVSVTVDFLPEGGTTGDYSKTGTATVTSLGQVSEIEGVVSRSITLLGNGALTVGTHS